MDRQELLAARPDVQTEGQFAQLLIGDFRLTLGQLESCVASKPPYGGVFAGAFWLKARLHLADDYRLGNRVAEAVAIEQDLRTYFAYADADHPLVKRLNER